MKDRWLNTGYYGQELQPHTETTHEIDEERIGKQQQYIFCFNKRFSFSVY